MMNLAKSVIAVAALGFGVAACSNGDSVRLTPQPGGGGNAPTAYTQIERLSRPAVKEVFERFVDHQISNASEPYNDPTLKQGIFDVTKAVGRSDATAASLQKVLYIDEYTVDLSSADKASYLGVETGGFTGGKFGGRDINDNVIDISLFALFGNATSKLGLNPDDGAENFCLGTQHVAVASRQGNTGAFPYLNAPY